MTSPGPSCAIARGSTTSSRSSLATDSPSGRRAAPGSKGVGGRADGRSLHRAGPARARDGRTPAVDADRARHDVGQARADAEPPPRSSSAPTWPPSWGSCKRAVAADPPAVAAANRQKATLGTTRRRSCTQSFDADPIASGSGRPSAPRDASTTATSRRGEGRPRRCGRPQGAATTSIMMSGARGATSKRQGS